MLKLMSAQAHVLPPAEILQSDDFLVQRTGVVFFNRIFLLFRILYSFRIILLVGKL